VNAQVETHRQLPGYVDHERDVTIERWDGIITWRTLINGDRTPTDTMTFEVAEIPGGAPTDGALHRHAVPEIYYVIHGTGIVHIDTPSPCPSNSVPSYSSPATPGTPLGNTGSETLKPAYVFAVDRFNDVAYEFPEDEAPHGRLDAQEAPSEIER